VADLILLEDGFDALAAAIGEGQRILNGMQDILNVFLTRILTLGLVIMSALVIGHFPIDLRNASAITLFTVGIPTALLAFWSRPGRVPNDTLQSTLARFVAPAAALGSLIGLLVFASVLLLRSADGGDTPAAVATAETLARTAVTAFLVFIGLLVVVFVEPPTARLAVAEPLSPDRRPTELAAILAMAFFVVLQVPPLRDFFSLHPLSPGDWLIIIAGVLAWTALVWVFWRYRFVDRFLGLPPLKGLAAPGPTGSASGTRYGAAQGADSSS
jgi:cation-transporting ATPase E